jgi:hypothetical protein
MGKVSRYATALPVLAAHGVAPGPDGLDPADLAAAAEARGWRVSTEPAAGAGSPQRRWRATVMGPASTGPAGVFAAGTHAYGATETEALAVALASMLRRGAR